MGEALEEGEVDAAKSSDLVPARAGMMSAGTREDEESQGFTLTPGGDPVTMDA